MSEEEKDIQIENENEMGENTDSRIYELGYLLVPSIEEANLPAVFGNLKELISSLKGVAISEDMPKLITLAYAMPKVVSNVRSKFGTAYFGWIKFSMDSDKLTELKAKLSLDPNVLRFLLIKTVRENTIATKRFPRGEMKRRTIVKKSEGEEAAAPINKEEIDKEIEALVANQ